MHLMRRATDIFSGLQVQSRNGFLAIAAQGYSPRDRTAEAVSAARHLLETVYRRPVMVKPMRVEPRAKTRDMRSHARRVNEYEPKMVDFCSLGQKINGGGYECLPDTRFSPARFHSLR